MNRLRVLLLCLVSVLVGLASVASPVPARAAYVQWGSVLVPGAQWAGPSNSLGDLNVYSNGNGNQDQYGAYGLDYECVELAARWAKIRFGIDNWNIGAAYQMWGAGPRLTPPMIQHPNGGSDGPMFGDLMIFDQVAGAPAGHVAVVAGTGPGWVDIVEQNYANYAPTGRARLSIDNGNYIAPRWGVAALGWLRASNRPPGLEGTEGPGGFTVDEAGTVYPYGSQLNVADQPLVPAGALVRGIQRIDGGSAGYVLDSSGQLYPFGGALPVHMSPLWRGQDVARALALTPGGGGAYVLDEHGGVRAMGNAPAVTAPPMWPNADMARDLVMRPDGAGGYILDAEGGIHPFGTAPSIRITPPTWPGQDRARAITLREDGTSGWILDAAGDLLSFGGAPRMSTAVSFPGSDMARSLVPYDADGGYTVAANGLVQAFGDAPGLTQGPHFSVAMLRGGA